MPWATRPGPRCRPPPSTGSRTSRRAQSPRRSAARWASSGRTTTRASPPLPCPGGSGGRKFSS
eukprot:3321312-Pyramimonas_sp.AAC.1